MQFQATSYLNIDAWSFNQRNVYVLRIVMIPWVKFTKSHIQHKIQQTNIKKNKNKTQPTLPTIVYLGSWLLLNQSMCIECIHFLK